MSMQDVNIEFEVPTLPEMDVSLEIVTNSTFWGNIEGDIADQTDLIDLIDTKIDIEATARENNDLLLQNGINTLNDDLTAEISNRGTADGILQDNIDTLSDTVTSNYNTLDGKIGNNKTAIDNHIADKTNPHEVTKSQVGLGNVDNTSDLNKPISTATQNALNTKVSNTREINGYALSSDITLTASDVGALPDTTTIGNGTLTIQKNGSTIDSFGANDTGNTTVNITVPTDTSDLTNNAGYIKGINSTDVTTALGYTPYNSTNPAGYTDNVGTVTSVNNAQPDSNGNVTLSIPAAQVNSDWNASSGVSKILNKPTLSTVATTGNYNDLTNKPTIPTNVSAFTNDAKYIQNTATGVYGLTIEGTASNNVSSINIGKNSLVGGGFCTVVGNDATCTGGDAVTIGFNATSADSSIAIGTFAKATGISSIQIGNGTNSTNRTCQIGDYRILDGAGKIPNDRIPSNIARTSDLATVATSGSYNDLSDKPTIPAAQVNSDWAETDTSSKAYIENKPTLSTVATTGDYDDLLNKPTIPTVNDATLTIQKNGSNVATFTANSSTNQTANITVPTQASDIGALPDTTTINDLTTAEQQSALNSGATSTNIGQIATNTQNISNEVTNRQNADNNLQSQIDALVVASDVFDIVGTYAELQAYDISTVPVNDIIKVLVDSTHDNAATYYRCVENNNVKSWSYIGAEGAYYTKSEADNRFVEQTTTVNGQALSGNITLTASDVGALPDSTVIGNGTLTIQKNGSTIDTFGANDTGNTTVNITVPTDTGDLTNNAGYTKNVGTVTSVNNTQPDANGNVTITIPTAVQSNWTETDTSSDAYIKNKPTIPTKTSDLTNDSNFISNTATGNASLTVQGTANNKTSSINIGALSSATDNFCTVVGTSASASKDNAVAVGTLAKVSNTLATAIGTSAEASGLISTAIGSNAKATGNLAIQIGYGTNSTNLSMAVGFGTDKEYQLLDGTTGLIPDARISSNIARTSDLSTVATSGSYNDLSDKPTIPAAQVQANWNETDTSSKAYIQNKPTIPSTSNFVTTNTAQNVTARKTFVGEKAINLKQSASTNKLGFTLYNRSDTEVGGLEYNPSSNILALNAPKTVNTLVGFRYWGGSASNIIVPKPTSGDYYIPLSFKNGSTTTTTNSSGVADLSNLIPTIATSVSASSTNAETVGAKLFYDTCGDIETLINAL